MSSSLCCGPARDAILSWAREQSPADELKSRALLDLLRTCDSLRKALHREIAPNTLTDSGFCVLARLLESAPRPASLPELANDLSLSPQVVSAALGRLEVSSLIARERSSDDRRVFTIKVTAAGRRAFADSLSRYLKSIAGVMSVLDPHEIAALDLACARLGESTAHALSS